MKKILLLLLLAAGMASCQKESVVLPQDRSPVDTELETRGLTLPDYNWISYRSEPVTEGNDSYIDYFFEATYPVGPLFTIAFDMSFYTDGYFAGRNRSIMDVPENSLHFKIRIGVSNYRDGVHHTSIVHGVYLGHESDDLHEYRLVMK